jgi:hypothetical protein
MPPQPTLLASPARTRCVVPSPTYRFNRVAGQPPPAQASGDFVPYRFTRSR